jgi:hypothetical protein
MVERVERFEEMSALYPAQANPHQLIHVLN